MNLFPTFKLIKAEFSFKNVFLPTMADDHTSDASGWFRNERLQKYCKYLYRQADAIIQELTITAYDCFPFSCHMQTVLMDMHVLWER